MKRIDASEEMNSLYRILIDDTGYAYYAVVDLLFDDYYVIVLVDTHYTRI